MKTLKKDELFAHLTGYLQTRGVELKDGTITGRVQKGCDLLTDTINFAQTNLKKAKEKVDQNLDRMRQTIHERTAPKGPAGPAKAQSTAPKSKAKKAAKRPVQPKTPEGKKKR